MDVARRAVDLSRTLRGQAGLKVRQPLARLWLALPGATLAERDALLDLIRGRGQRQGRRAHRRRVASSSTAA